MATVTGTSNHNVTFQQTAAATVIGTPTLSVPENANNTYTNGTAALKVDLLHAKIYTIAISTPQTLDLTSLTDIFGGSVPFARVRSATFKNTGSASITIGAAASNQWVGPLGTTTSTIVIPAGGSAFFEDPSSTSTSGWVVGSSNKSLKIDSGAAAGTLEMILAGCSA